MHRHSSYDEDVARELQKPKFAREFLLTLMEGEDGMKLIDALKHTIQRMGVKEFAEKADIHPKSVSRMLASSAIPKIETLDTYLAPFGLRSKVTLEKVA